MTIQLENNIRDLTTLQMAYQGASFLLDAGKAYGRDTAEQEQVVAEVKAALEQAERKWGL